MPLQCALALLLAELAAAALNASSLLQNTSHVPPANSSLESLEAARNTSHVPPANSSLESLEAARNTSLVPPRNSSLWSLEAARNDSANFEVKNYSYKITCYSQTSIAFHEESVSCRNSSLGQLTQSHQSVGGNLTCFGSHACAADIADGVSNVLLRRYDTRVTSLASAALLGIWILFGLCGLQEFWRKHRKGKLDLATLSNMSGFHRQLIGLSLISTLLLVSGIGVSSDTLWTEVPCTFAAQSTLLEYVLTQLALRLLSSVVGHMLVIGSFTAAKVLQTVKQLPRGTYFIHSCKMHQLIKELLDTEPVWMDRLLQMEESSYKECFLWKAATTDKALVADLLNPSKSAKITDLTIEVLVKPADDFTLYALHRSGGFFALEVDGHRIERKVSGKHIMHVSSCPNNGGGDVFWSYFWSQYPWNCCMLGLCHAVWEGSRIKKSFLHIEKSVRLLPVDELRALIREATVANASSDGVHPSDVRHVERVGEWRKRALRGALQCAPPPVGSSGPSSAPLPCPFLQTSAQPELKFTGPRAGRPHGGQPQGGGSKSSSSMHPSRRQQVRAALRAGDYQSEGPFRCESDPMLRSYIRSLDDGEEEEEKQQSPDSGVSHQEDDLAPNDDEELDELPPTEVQSLDILDSDLAEEAAKALWRDGSATQKDWYRVIAKAEFWLTHAFLELARREPGVGCSLEAACEVLSSGLRSGRLSPRDPGCAAVRARVEKELDQELRQALVSMDRPKIDRLCAACDPLLLPASAVPHAAVAKVPSLITKPLANLVTAHLKHLLEFAMSMQDRRALSLALIETFRICGDLQTEPPRIQTEGMYFSLGLLTLQARNEYVTHLFEESRAASGLSKLAMGQIVDQSCGCKLAESGSPLTMQQRWQQQVQTPGFLKDMQGFMDLIGECTMNLNSEHNDGLASKLEVVQIRHLLDEDSLRAYFTRREEVKVSMHPKCAGSVGDCLTVAASGPWTHNVIRSSQGVWADKSSDQIWVIYGEQVTSGPVLIAELINPDASTRLRSDHGLMQFRAMPWPHLMARPRLERPNDSDSDVSLLWMIMHVGHAAKVSHKQITGIIEDNNAIYWSSNPKDQQSTRWEREVPLLGYWIIGGCDAVILPTATFSAAANLLNQVGGKCDTMDHGKACAAWCLSSIASIEAELRERGRNEECSYLLLYKGYLYPIWQSVQPPHLDSIFQFSSIGFVGSIDRSSRRIDILPCHESWPIHPTFNKKLNGFRKCFPIKLGRKPLDMNANEIWLVQGTRKGLTFETKASEVQLRLMSGHHGTALGAGIYLTDSAVKADMCTEPDQQGYCAMLICRVCLGRCINQSEGGDRCKVQMRGSNEYHSVKSLGQFNEYVVFDPSQVYVEYIVWYRRKSGTT